MAVRGDDEADQLGADDAVPHAIEHGEPRQPASTA
jgi:hypothetical protein